MLSKKVLLDYMQNIEDHVYELEDTVDELSLKVKQLEKKLDNCPCTKDTPTKVKRGPGRPKGSKTKTEK